MQRHISGEVALRLLDEIVRVLERKQVLPPHDIESIVAALNAEAERCGYNLRGNVALCASDHALGWLIPPE